MTRQEFIQNITDWYDLYDISENIDYYAWKEIRDKLNGIPTNYEFYRKDEPFEWVGLDDDDFFDYKEDALTWMDNGGYWEEDDEDLSNDGQFLEDMDLFSPDDDAVAEEDFSVSDLIGMCSVDYITIQQDDISRERENTAAFNQFINPNMPKVLR